MEILESIYWDAGICFVGLALHFAMKWAEARQKAPLSARAYIESVPAQSLVSLLATVGAFAVCYRVGWMNPGMAFACGYMGNSIAENIANRFSSQLPK